MNEEHLAVQEQKSGRKTYRIDLSEFTVKDLKDLVAEDRIPTMSHFIKLAVEEKLCRDGHAAFLEKRRARLQKEVEEDAQN